MTAKKAAAKPKPTPRATNAERYETLRPQLVAYLADGMSYAKTAAALGITRVMTVWEWAQREEIPALIRAEREKRHADREHLRLARLEAAHDLYWRVATGKETIKNDDQRKAIAYYLGVDEQAPPPAAEPLALTDGQPQDQAGRIPPGTTVQILMQAPPAPTVVKGEQDDSDGARADIIDA